jgi:hypothetical protein
LNGTPPSNVYASFAQKEDEPAIVALMAAAITGNMKAFLSWTAGGHSR